MDASVSNEMVIDANGHEYVDLGLPSGTLWATMNVGANSPEDYGDYYAWGETETKTSYTDRNYTLPPINEIAGTQYDVAHVKWGGSWVMPSRAQIEELIEYCENGWLWTTWHSREERLEISRDDGMGSIFIPAVKNVEGMRYGEYWMSTRRDGLGDYFRIDDITEKVLVNADSLMYTYRGLLVRPVLTPKKISLKDTIDAKANTEDLATVATTGSYNDLVDKPNILTGLDEVIEDVEEHLTEIDTSISSIYSNYLNKNAGSS